LKLTTATEGTLYISISVVH